NPGVRYTQLPGAGRVIDRGESLYELDGRPVPLFYGNVTPYRALQLGVAPGPDVAMLNRNLVALGFEPGPASDSFTAQTAAAVRAWQQANGLPVNGVVALGDIAIAPGALRVTSVTAADGAAVQPGSPVLTATALARQVVVQLDAALQSEIAVGDRVTITLPNDRNTPGRVSYVGKVATSPSSDQGGSSTPTINVYITPSDPAATGTLSDAPVTVAITTGSARGVLVAPVASLLALAGGGYAIEQVQPDGAHVLQAVATGLFDDADGLVQISGPGVHAGERIVQASDQ
ncbi:MAG TPA: peptidoglycan-binding protein, partial [Solirubrobacteraceae bacterium]|nr:peptidoglycan-binding protein [Solirubrobacteraceae bacterium]